MLLVLLLLVMALFKRVLLLLAFLRRLGLGHARGQLDLLDTLARSALSRDEDYDQIPDDDFATASVGNSSPEYTRQQWDGPHASEDNILCSEIFKGLDVCRRALDRTITSAELKIIESLLPLEP
ncbi:hypothetical protein Tco_0293771, partial [Tanacetum coccineum]